VRAVTLECATLTSILSQGERKDKQRRNPMRRKILSVLLATLFLATASLADAQQTGKVVRIGFLDPSTASGSAVLVDAFRQELSKLGWIEGKNISVDYRFAEGKRERLPELAVDLVRLKVNLIVVTGMQSALAAKKATTNIPIVIASAPDPVGLGLVAGERLGDVVD